MWQGQTDEGELGFSYEKADQILHLCVDKKKNEEEIIKVGFDSHIVKTVLTRMEQNKFKQKLPFFLV